MGEPNMGEPNMDKPLIELVDASNYLEEAVKQVRFLAQAAQEASARG